ncbi:uncharacterized protein LOC115881099 [Sitophilus oryzae]|uniref:Uncharacterized protein LOC115881099 n=1 Tax=Sitophilus oryzae TaxID=7048 RepID=A0A6J2XUT2_SITOR|nr:uncharacterized protein LOC115881099 [Sitophilus oryzae]
MSSRLRTNAAEETGVLTTHFGAQSFSLTGEEDRLAVGGAQASTSAATGKGKCRTRKSGASGSLSDSSSSVKRQESSPTLTLISSKVSWPCDRSVVQSRCV